MIKYGIKSMAHSERSGVGQGYGKPFSSEYNLEG